jgi:hypothetical protein
MKQQTRQVLMLLDLSAGMQSSLWVPFHVKILNFYKGCSSVVKLLIMEYHSLSPLSFRLWGEDVKAFSDIRGRILTTDQQ